MTFEVLHVMMQVVHCEIIARINNSNINRMLTTSTWVAIQYCMNEGSSVNTRSHSLFNPHKTVLPRVRKTSPASKPK